MSRFGKTAINRVKNETNDDYYVECGTAVCAIDDLDTDWQNEFDDMERDLNNQISDLEDDVRDLKRTIEDKDDEISQLEYEIRRMR